MGNSDEAAAMRVIELNVSIPTHLLQLYKDEIKDTLEKNSGFAGDVFMSFLVQPSNLAKVKGLLKEMYAQIYALTKWEHKHRYWVRTLACVAVGGILARQLGLIECSVDRIIRWAIDQLRVHVTPAKKHWQVAAIGAYFNDRLGERLIVDTHWRAGQNNVVLGEPRKGVLSIRHERDLDRYIVAVSSLREYCIERGLSYTELMHFLADNKIVIAARRVILGAGTQYAGAQVNCVFIDGLHPLLTGVERPRLVSSSHAHQ
jgi:hypothetical protein